jgi:copper transporter 1
MLFTWDTSNLCIVFRQWHITSNLSLVVSLAAIVAICAGYEALREGIRRYEAKLTKRVDTAPRKLFHSPSSPHPLFFFHPQRPGRRLVKTLYLPTYLPPYLHMANPTR